MIRIRIGKIAQKDLKKLDSSIANRILEKFQELKAHPAPHTHLKKLRGYENLHRFHIGPAWVAVGELNEDILSIRWVGHRREIYKRLQRV